MSDTNRTAKPRGIPAGQQLPLVVETKTEALHALAAQVGGWKVLAAAMKPELADDPEAAGRWLSDALNPDRREVLHDEHFFRALRLGVHAGSDVLMAWLCQYLGYQAPAPVEPKSDVQRAAEMVARCAEDFQRAMDLYDRAQRQDAVREVTQLRAPAR